jgi:GMP synthase (glutamine-hydrolysing)
VQIFRIGSNVYATQFHAELDVAGMATRIGVYKHAGYFDPAEADDIMARAVRSNVTWPAVILRQFVQRYAPSGPSGTADPAGSGPGLPSSQVAGHR